MHAMMAQSAGLSCRSMWPRYFGCVCPEFERAYACAIASATACMYKCVCGACMCACVRAGKQAGGRASVHMSVNAWGWASGWACVRSCVHTSVSACRCDGCRGTVGVIGDGPHSCSSATHKRLPLAIAHLSALPFPHPRSYCPHPAVIRACISASES